MIQTSVAVAVGIVTWGVATRLFNDAACASIQQTSLAYKEISYLLVGCFW